MVKIWSGCVLHFLRPGAAVKESVRIVLLSRQHGVQICRYVVTVASYFRSNVETCHGFVMLMASVRGTVDYLVSFWFKLLLLLFVDIRFFSLIHFFRVYFTT